MLNFYRGLKERYTYPQSPEYEDAIFFAKDTHEILMNGEVYGAEGSAGIKDISFDEDTNIITITNSDESTLTIDLSNKIVTEAWKEILTKLENNTLLTLEYDSKDIKLMCGSTVVSSIPASDFIKDGMLNNVVLDGHNLVFQFNTDSGKQDISIALDEFIDVYTAGTGIEITGNQISVKLAGVTEFTEITTRVRELETEMATKADKSDALRGVSTYMHTPETTPDYIAFDKCDGKEYSKHISLMKINGKSVATTSGNAECIFVPTKDQFDTLQQEVNKKVNQVEGKDLSTNDFTDLDKLKSDTTTLILAETPIEIEPTMTVCNVTLNTLSPSGDTVNEVAHTAEIPQVTPLSAGVMSSEDKAKLDRMAPVTIVTQAEFDALETKYPNTVYIIKG